LKSPTIYLPQFRTFFALIHVPAHPLLWKLRASPPSWPPLAGHGAGLGIYGKSRLDVTYKDIFISYHRLLPVGAPVRLSVQTAVLALKAMAEPTRLRLLVLLASGELNVKDLTRILGQSQPRISRHLKLLAEAGLVERAPEGSWVYFRLGDGGEGGALAQLVLEAVEHADPVLARDRRRAEALREERERAAQAYFQSHAGEWDRIRALHVAEAQVESVVSEVL